MTGRKILEVYYHGKSVGKLAEMHDKRIAFQYDIGWVRQGFPISPFSLPLKEDVFIPPNSSREVFNGLFGVFADSLPDSWGELLLDRYLESLGIKREDISTLDRLAYVGSSGMGALEYIPSKEAELDITTAGLDFDKVAKECKKILSSKTSDQLDLLYKMAGSSGGTRPKILLSEEGKEYIIKFPAKKDPSISGKREYDYYITAGECGIVMSDSFLIPSAECEGYFKTERFDRKGNNKVFSITFAALLEADFRAPSCDYETYFRLVRVLTKDNRKDKEQLFKMMCFNILTHNLDDHTKNFSFTYTNESGWRLAPAYDLTYSDTYWGEHTTSVNGKGKDISKDNLINIGMNAGLPKSFCEKSYEDIYAKTRVLENYLDISTQKRRRRTDIKKQVEDLKKQL